MPAKTKIGNDKGPVMRQGVRRRSLIALLAIAVALLLWGGWTSWSYRRSRRAMAEAREEIEAGRHATAARILITLLNERPGFDEAAYLLGTCEKAAGRARAAAEAWARVPPGSSFAPRAIQRLMELEVDGGRFAAAEQIVKLAMQDPRNDASALPLFLGPVYWLQGRIDEARQSIEDRWHSLNDRGQGASEKAIELVRLHIELERNPLPIESVRQGLEDAGRMAPDDDRVWLGKANLAIRSGTYEEAERWLVPSLKRRPNDHAVWRARLNWALATNRVVDVRNALTHVPVAESSPAELPRLSAWLARRRGDRESERGALEQVVAADPADFAALDRLAELPNPEGQVADAAVLRQRKVDIERLLARYLELHQRYQPVRDAAEMAALAQRLGRQFEARAFMTVAVSVNPDRDDLTRDLAGLGRRDRQGGAPRLSLAEALAVETGLVSDKTIAAPVHDSLIPLVQPSTSSKIK
jgi:enediyne biosynthesis protein E4